ncbi:MAG: alanyl-tRNA synthetase [Candidatus Azotimanducaceae bacterium]|jgi:alanyl-tRNA synthetase|tara:strand:- start:1334 stop:3934 length:2601 start_codon:yes stop_codon:yes gene_type:complete
MNSEAIRKAYLDFFKSKGHTVVESASLVPDNDPTLLFTNSGMVQFKDAFAMLENRGYTRAVSCQRCIRAGGKHNDLDNVGYTARHHTFFEMLGNFSFGDYFKSEAIAFAWEFLTEVIKVPKDRLWVTIHDSDDEAHAIWVNEIGFPANRITRMGDKDNFWTMGDTGPCGPCSEIFYDHGEAVPGGPPGSEGDDLDRFVEIWNLVFTQYDRSADGTLTPLPSQCVDTGMGLERLAAVMQSVHNNYDTDLFQPMIVKAAEVLGVSDLQIPSLKVIADHLRSSVFLICDGVLPSNEGRGYVMRRIMRRALRHGHALGATKPFFHELVPVLVAEMGETYPMLIKTSEQIERIVLKEETQFALTLDQGMRILDEAIAGLADQTIPGEVIFKLYDTYGFPADLTGDIARERDLLLDMAGFESEMSRQRNRARAASKFQGDGVEDLEIDAVTTFLGYDALDLVGSVVAIHNGTALVDTWSGEGSVSVVLDQTPFYAESGGQVGDQGRLIADGVELTVLNTKKSGHAIIHYCQSNPATLAVGDQLQALVSPSVRQNTARHHSATHLLHAALRTVLGDHVNQRGSMVSADRLRFDFSHFEAVSTDELQAIEGLCNQEILKNTPISTEVMGVEAAKERGAMALFGEKYSESVRVLTMGDGFSMELCGGTHALRTGDLGLLRVVSEQGIASGVRRIEAVVGEQALSAIAETDAFANAVSSALKTDRGAALVRLEQLIEHNRRLEKEVAALNTKLVSGESLDTADAVFEVQGISVLVNLIDGADPKSLPDALDQLKNKLGRGVVVLATAQAGKIALVVGVTKDLTNQVHAGELVNHIALQVGGKGGGRPDMARAGGSDVDALPAALASVEAYLAARLG